MPCDDAVWWCVGGILRGSESVPSGFRSWLIQSGRNYKTVYVWTTAGYQIARRVITGDDHCTGGAGSAGSFYNFTYACDTHDLAYALIRFLKSWRSRLSANSFFLADMCRACSLRSNWSVRHKGYARALSYYTLTSAWNWRKYGTP